ncbi:hypothetical protein RRG08_003824 [Elysia crispata]|uniref:Uncharacterized protein n=1 Tax=Elysia crispata TaxID=231223 RepID=A0AAE0ZFS7_9GAST|nr:hypothetical protein RRG08_003824 [Elysia crispata]
MSRQEGLVHASIDLLTTGEGWRIYLNHSTVKVCISILTRKTGDGERAALKGWRPPSVGHAGLRPYLPRSQPQDYLLCDTVGGQWTTVATGRIRQDVQFVADYSRT